MTDISVGYKQIEIGIISNDWEIKNLGEIVKITKGKKVDFSDKGEKGYIDIGILRTNQIVQYTDDNGVECKNDDILIAWDGSKSGTIGYGLNGIIGSTLAKLEITEKDIYTPYVGEFLKSKFDYLNTYTSGAAIPHIRKEVLVGIEIPLPPLETQKAIVAKLDQIFTELDQTKSEIQKNLDNTDELWKSALNQAFQGDWEMKKLGEIYDITSSKRVFQKDWRTSGVPFYRAREIVKLAENGFVDNELFITEEMYEEYGKKYGLPKENDIMVTGVGTIGICYFVKKTDKFYFKDGNILWFKHNFEGINSRFVEYLFKSELLKSQINNGASTVVATLTIEKAKGLTIPVPPLSEQEKIVEHLDQVSKEVKTLKSQYQSQLDNLEELKKSVLDKAFRGELE